MALSHGHVSRDTRYLVTMVQDLVTVAVVSSGEELNFSGKYQPAVISLIASCSKPSTVQVKQKPRLEIRRVHFEYLRL